MLLPELDLGEDLVGEGVGHDEAGVSHGTAEVDKTALSEQDDVAAVGQLIAVHLRLDVVLLGVLVEPFRLDLTVEVTDVADDGILLHDHQVLVGDDVLASGGRDEDSGLGSSLLHGGHLETCVNKVIF